MATNLGSGELAKPNSKTGEPRTEILKRLIKKNQPVELMTGKKVKFKNTKDNLLLIEKYIKDRKTFSLEDSTGNFYPLTKIKKGKEFGGGGGGAGGGTEQTAINESAQCLWLAAVLANKSKPIEFFTDDVLKKYVSKIDVDMPLKKILDIDFTWKKSSYMSAHAIIKGGYVNQRMKFHRGSTFMKEIYKAKDRAFKNSGFSKFTDDKWNPGDIWAIKTNFNPKNFDDSSVKGLQRDILEKFVKKECVGISLKKIEKKVIIKKINIKLPPDVADYTVKNLLLESASGTFWSSKGATIVFSDGRMNAKDNAAFGSIKVEIEGTTARGGGAGWTYITDAAKQVFNKILPRTGVIAADARAMAAGDAKTIDKFFKMYKICYPGGKKQDFVTQLSEKDAAWIHAKYGVTMIISLIKGGSKAKGNRYVTKLVNYAGSATEDSSAYIKVYE
jgi:hypothetical protein